MATQAGAGGGTSGRAGLLIAATALRHGAVLVTRKLSECSRVHGLEVIDWHGGSTA